MAAKMNELAITTAFYVICCVLSILMTVYLYYSIYTNKKKKRLSAHSLYYAAYIMSVLSLTFGIYTGAIRCFLSYINRVLDSSNLLQNQSINVYANSFHFIGSNLFSIIILLNIQNVFNNTIYSLDKKTFILVIIMIILQSASALWLTLNEANTIQMFLQTATVCMIVFGLLLNSLLMLLLITKLRNIILMHTDCNLMIDKIIKHTFLFSTAALFNIIFYIVLICDKFTSYSCDGWFVLLPRCLHELSIIIALYFSFKFNEEIYYKICYQFHQLNRKCCIKNENNVLDDIEIKSELQLQNDQSNTYSDVKTVELESNGLESIVRFVMNVTQTDNEELNRHKIRMKRILNNLHDTTSEEASFDKLSRDDADDTSTEYKD